MLIDLPRDILGEIITCLPDRDQRALMFTCRTLKKLIWAQYKHEYLAHKFRAPNRKGPHYFRKRLVQKAIMYILEDLGAKIYISRGLGQIKFTFGHEISFPYSDNVLVCGAKNMCTRDVQTGIETALWVTHHINIMDHRLIKPVLEGLAPFMPKLITVAFTFTRCQYVILRARPIGNWTTGHLNITLPKVEFLVARYNPRENISQAHKVFPNLIEIVVKKTPLEDIYSYNLHLFHELKYMDFRVNSRGSGLCASDKVVMDSRATWTGKKKQCLDLVIPVDANSSIRGIDGDIFKHIFNEVMHYYL